MRLISHFEGEFACYSNFYPAPVEMYGELYPSVEHAYQAAKCRWAQDRKQFQNDRLAAGKAKQLGQEIEIRSDWEEIKLGIMERLVERKFQIPVLHRRLLASVDAELVEGNTWGDRFWGVCQGEGQNHLGQILMKVRAQIKAKDDEVKKLFEDLRNSPLFLFNELDEPVQSNLARLV